MASPPLSTPWRARLETRLLLFVTLVTGAAVAAMLVAANRVITAGAVERTHEDQDAAKQAFDRLLERRGEFATSQSRLITELPVFRAHLSDPRIAGDRGDDSGAGRSVPRQRGRRLPARRHRRRGVAGPIELARAGRARLDRR